jgi:hypothetical protein
MGMTREEAITIARYCAKEKPQSYYAEPFQPHEWVIDAILLAAARPVTAAPAEPITCFCSNPKCDYSFIQLPQGAAMPGIAWQCPKCYGHDYHFTFEQSSSQGEVEAPMGTGASKLQGAPAPPSTPASREPK